MTHLERRPKPRWPKRSVGLVSALLAVGLLLSLFRSGPAPEVTIHSPVNGIGRSGQIEVEVAGGGRGLSGLEVELLQGEARHLLAQKQYTSRPAWAFWGQRDLADRVEVEVGSDSLGEALSEGTATVRVQARGPAAWLRKAGVTQVEREFPVLLRPPLLGVISRQHYPTQGGSGVVVYSVGSTSARDGVDVDGSWYPGFPLAEAPGRRMALYAVPFDLGSAESIRLVAEDAVGNMASVGFVDRLRATPSEADRIEVSTAFMERVVPEIVANSPSVRQQDTLLETYLTINGDLRARNAERLTELAADSRPEFLWTERFIPLPNAQVMSAFADRRTYFFEGREVDRQDHLGFDLASVKRAPVPAANSGVVVLAQYFGIYGNAVVIDHGYGLMSLYGHLSGVEVDVGQSVERGQTVGRTGETGLAGGDHLHFTMLLRGQAVNPVEWWDESWLQNRLRSKLMAAAG